MHKDGDDFCDICESKLPDFEEELIEICVSKENISEDFEDPEKNFKAYAICVSCFDNKIVPFILNKGRCKHKKEVI